MAIDPVSLAVTVALTAAQMAMTASQNIEGPRVTDLNATVADYGTPLNYFYNKRWLTCPCFWAEDIREQKKKRKTKAGKFTEYTYFGTWAVHIADHAIGQVSRIKFDGHLVYDINAEDPLFELDDGYDLDNAVRFYYGTPDQMPDPRMQATVEAERGEGTCPAYRNQAYIMFEDIPLEKLGNRLPIVTVEASNGSTLAENVIELDFVNGVYTVDGTPTALSAIVDVTIGPALGTAIVPGTGWVVDEDTNVYGQSRFVLKESVVDMLSSGGSMGVAGEYEFVFQSDTTPVAGGTTAARFSHYVNPSPLFAPSWVSQVTYVAPEGTDASEVRGLLTYRPDAQEIYYPPTTMIGTYTSRYNRVGITEGENAISEVGDREPDGIDDIGFTITAWSPDNNATGIVRSLTIRSQRSSVETPSKTLADIMADLCLRAGLSADDFDFSQLDTIEIDGFSWSQGSVKQIAAPLMDVFDFDIRPHDFKIEALLRGGTPQGTITDFAKAEPRHALDVTADSDLPRRVFFNFADIDSDQQTNTAVSQRRAEDVSTSREMTLDLTTLAMEPARARRYTDRYLRRQWFGRTKGSSTLTRQHLAIEPGDVWTPTFDGLPVTMVCTKLTIAADGTMPVEWKADVPGLNTLSAAPGAPALGIPPATIYAASATEGAVLDLPLLVDAHDQTVPFAYVAASPTEPGKAWPGAQFAQSDTGESESFVSDWDSVGSIEASEMGTVTGALPDALPWAFDDGSTVEVVIHGGELVSTTEAALIEDGTLNLAAIGSEVVQFRTATLTAAYTYTLSGFLRGRRGTEWAMPDHVAGERFVLLAAAKKHALGASEIGDTDSYIAHTIGKAANEGEAFDLTYTGASHKPYAPVDPVVAQSGADWTVNATRRTRVGGTTLNGQDVPLGETSEAWELDILDGSTVVRTIAATSLPVTYTEAMQIADFGSPLGSAPNGRLYQMNPALNLRGYPLAF